MHNLSRAAINKRFRNPTMATVSNFTSSYTVFKWLNAMSYAMRIDSWTSGTVWYNRLANPNNLRDDGDTQFFNRNPVECIEFLMQQPAFRQHMSYGPAKKFNDAEECIYSEEKSSDWWWNEQVRSLNFVIAMMIVTPSLATAAAWSYDSPFIRQFRPDTSYQPLGRQEAMASIFESRKHRLDDWIKAFNSCKHSCCPSSHSSEISL